MNNVLTIDAKYLRGIFAFLQILTSASLSFFSTASSTWEANSGAVNDCRQADNSAIFSFRLLMLITVCLFMAFSF